jgi:hypothetical protein
MTQDILLIRKWFTNLSVIGELFFREYRCYTLEDLVREGQEKIPGKTAIPYGRYRVIINYSPRFKKPLPLLLNVPLFYGVRIHSGNKPEDTDGCILIGERRDTDCIYQSIKAMETFIPLLSESLQGGTVYISIVKSENIEGEENG